MQKNLITNLKTVENSRLLSLRTYLSIWRHLPDDNNILTHSRQNFKYVLEIIVPLRV